jgi:mono/diheme cytochrome c family protein
MGQIKHILPACLLIVVVYFLAFGFIKIYPDLNQQVPSEEIKLLSAAAEVIPPSPEVTQGLKIFKANCQSCHLLNKDANAPALSGFTERGPWSDRKKLYEWIKNPAKFMAGDPYTSELKSIYGYVMTPFPDLSEKDIDAIVAYVEHDAQ